MSFFSNNTDENGYVCNRCKRYNPMSFIFCPNCGKERFSRSDFDRMETLKQRVQDPVSEDEIIVYLRKMGLLHLAYQQYQIQIQLENGEMFVIPLIGKQNSNDVLAYLIRELGLSKEDIYDFSDWPYTDSHIGPCCVCEIDVRKVYHVIGKKKHEMSILYGCPNAKSRIQSNVIENARVEIIDYES